jgi:trk system potassium uptake protein
MIIEKFAVIGLGNFGYSVAKNLALKGAEVLAMDKNMDRVDAIKDDVAYAVCLDSTDIKALNSQNISDMDAVMVAIGENIESLLLTTVLLLDLKVKRIIARAVNQQQRVILEKLGVKEILSPENEVGIMVAEKLLNPNMASYIQLPDGYQIVEIRAPRRILKRTIEDINFNENYDLDLIAIRRIFDEQVDGKKVGVEHLINKPSHNIAIDASDVIVVMGKAEDIDKFVDANK